VPCAVVIGSEGEGVGKLVLSRCDYRVRIPVKGKVNSLNASAAAAVIVFETQRQRMLKAL
jgi:23S rRNA (guanosine2251-2'-O)-methyltransferase